MSFLFGNSHTLLENFMHNRVPSVTIKTNAYHFCKLSLVKQPSSDFSSHHDGPKCINDRDEKPVDAETLGCSGDKAQGFSTEHACRSEGSFKLIVHVIFLFQTYG